MTRVRRWIVWMLVAAVVVLVGCSVPDVEPGPQAFIHSVEVVEDGGSYIAEIEGDYPDTCSTTGEVDQEMNGQTLVVTVYTEQDEDANLSCEPVLTPFSDDIELDVEGLSAGQYTVTVNGTVTTMTLLSDQ